MPSHRASISSIPVSEIIPGAPADLAGIKTSSKHQLHRRKRFGRYTRTAFAGPQYQPFRSSTASAARMNMMEQVLRRAHAGVSFTRDNAIVAVDVRAPSTGAQRAAGRPTKGFRDRKRESAT